MFDIRYSLFRSFLFDQTGCPLAGGRRSYETTSKSNRRISNKKYRILKCGTASICSF
ncbi:hypothetical protein D1AOALGA4SA_1871 [Olavius algarvensis Delta 1 endosymbiont]|nr:hypothetical protein D1AOALGA4SA_1871 [Olavius algarvensis Delta 1 endosymbiont]